MNNPDSSLRSHVDRRAFLKRGSLFLAGTAAVGPLLETFANAKTPDNQSLRIRMLTDVHYAERKTAGTRHYRDSVKKIREAMKAFKRSKVDFALELGDFIDANIPQNELDWLKNDLASTTKPTMLCSVQ